MKLRASHHAIDRAWERWDLDLAAYITSIDRQIVDGTAATVAIEDSGRIRYGVKIVDRNFIVVVTPDNHICTIMDSTRFKEELSVGAAQLPREKHPAPKYPKYQLQCTKCRKDCYSHHYLVKITERSTRGIADVPFETVKPAETIIVCKRCWLL